MPTYNFQEAVCEVVARIPEGKVMTYGDIAACIGNPYAARQVGGVAHFGPSELPWHRVVNRFGDCASGYYGGKAGHAAALEQEGITILNFRIVDFERYHWRPI